MYTILTLHVRALNFKIHSFYSVMGTISSLTSVQRRYLSYFGGIVKMNTNVTLKLLLECLFLIMDKC